MKTNYYRIHNELLNQTLVFLSSQQLGTFWSNATGALKTTSGHFQRYGLKGSSDIIGMTKSGRFTAIEIKTGSARQSKHQVAFQKMVEKNGGAYMVVRSEVDFDALKQLLS